MSFRFQFRASRYITGLNWISELKVITVCICYELPFSISSVSIYYGTQLDIRVKSYCGFHLLGASVFNFERLIYYGTKSNIRGKSYCRLNFVGASIFNFEGLDILRDSIGHPSKKLLSFEFPTSFRFQFRASRYITRLNQTSE